MNKIKTLAFSILAIGLTSQVFAADAAKGKTKTAMCAGCHGADGNSPLNMYPKLAGQGAKYLIKQLNDFKSVAGKQAARVSPMMAGTASTLSKEDIEDISAYYSTQKVQHTGVDKKYIELGQKLYRGGDPDRDIPACMACHGANGKGMASAGFPALGGQYPAYTKAQLEAFRSGKRDNDSNSVMRDIVSKMSDKQIEALAFYLAGLH